MGALLGAGAIPGRWFADLELKGAIERLADDLYAVSTDRSDYGSAEVWTRYPAW